MGDCACTIDSKKVKYSDEAVPNTFFLELTPACNNHCRGCGNVFTDNRFYPVMDADTWEIIIQKLPRDVTFLKITGGEPTLHPAFIIVISRIQAYFTLFTNGRWEQPRKLIQFLKHVSNLHSVLISLHGADAGAHESFTQVEGSFYETLSNIRMAADAGLNISTSTVITRHNWNQIDEIIHLTRSIGAKQAVFNRYIGQPIAQLEPTIPQLKHALTVIEAHHRQTQQRSSDHMVRFGTPIPRSFIPNSSGLCLAGIYYGTIDPWGNIRPCNHSPLICGNLLDQPFHDIWYSEKMKSWRALHRLYLQKYSETISHHHRCLVSQILN